MNAIALLAETEKAGISLAATERGTLKYAGDPAALARLLPEIREHKAEILAALAANDPQPVKTYRLWLIEHPNGRTVSHATNTPDTLAEFQRAHPGAEIEPAPEPDEPAPELHPANLEQANIYLRHIEEDDPEGIADFMDGLARHPERLAWLYQECVRLGIATTEIVESIGDRLESEITRAADPLAQLESLNHAFGVQLAMAGRAGR